MASRAAPIPDLPMEEPEIRPLGHARIRALEPLEDGELEVGKAPTLLEGEEGAARRDGDDGDAWDAADRPGVHDDQRAAGREPGKLDDGSGGWLPSPHLAGQPLEQVDDRPGRIAMNASEPSHHILREGQCEQLGGPAELERPAARLSGHAAIYFQK